MLRRVANVRVFSLRDAPGPMITGKYRIILQIGKKEHRSTFRMRAAPQAGCWSKKASVRRLNSSTFS